MIEAVNGHEPAYIVIRGVNEEARSFPPFSMLRQQSEDRRLIAETLRKME